MKPGVDPPAHAVIALVSSVTVPFRANALPCRLALVAMVMLVSATMFPWNALNVPRAAELPTCQKTSQGEAPPIRLTIDAPGPDAVVSEETWKT